MNRLGYHFRCSIVEEARKVLNEMGHHEQAAYVHEPGKPEPIPNSQREIDLEADAVLRDLFPRIPNTDRQEIIDHAFKKVRVRHYFLACSHDTDLIFPT